MFLKLKSEIKNLAKAAVLNAESVLGSNNGKQKKEMAIKFVIEKLPIPNILKPLISIIFSEFINETIEFAVEFMKKQ